MKALTLITIMMMIFASGAVFACDGSGDKDTEDQSFTINTQYLCGGGNDDSSEPDETCATCGCTKSKPEQKPEAESDDEADSEEEEAEADEESDETCGGDKVDKPADEPEFMCGSSCGGGKDKDKEKTKA